eukprot:TRINITY_DN21134_c0_g4_i1.p1 TRINITY_DN21134_c0_g4~~TRINITY_DN21134_c0_g4_i1.p1  ORF type:complete len:1590 (+),score=298.91 TRINITY_DN21134_c0_g4_i1:701-4771(+)
MEEVVADPFPNDPPLPHDVPAETFEQCVHGRVAWLVDNPGRQQIGSFHPITDGDWTEGAFLSADTEELVTKCVADDAMAVTAILDRCGSDQLLAKDFLGRTVLHVAALGNAPKACEALLARPEADANFLQARLADGRFSLHLAAMHGFERIVAAVLAKRQELAAAKVAASAGAAAEVSANQMSAANVEVLDIDGADWERKLSPLQYAVVLGHERIVEILLKHGANAKKQAVHKDKNMSRSIISLCALYARESRSLANAEKIFRRLLEAGASTTQVNFAHETVWHELASDPKDADILKLLLSLESEAARKLTLDVLNTSGQSALFVAVQHGNHAAVEHLLDAGATAMFTTDEYSKRREAASNQDATGGRRMFGRGNSDELLKPVLAAAESVRVECLRVLLRRCPESANAFRKHKPPQSLLDILEQKRKELQEQQNSKDEERAKLEKASKSASQSQAAETPGTYAKQVWDVISCVKAFPLQQFDKEHDDIDDEEDEASNFESKLAKIDAAVALVREHGGKPYPRGEEDGSEESHGFGRGFFRSHGRFVQDNLTQPFENYGELDCVDLSQTSQFRFMRQTVACKLSSSAQKRTHELFDAAFRGDEQELQLHAKRTKFCVVNAVGATPLSVLAARVGSASIFRDAFHTAMLQYRPPARSAPADPGDENDVAAQLKRLDNFAIAAGEAPKDAGPNPDQMRERLVALERGVANEPSDAVEESVKSKVPPLQIMLQKGVFMIDKVPSLVDLLARLRSAATELAVEQGEEAAKCEEQEQPPVVHLSPLEVAIVTGDLPMVQTILELASKEVKPDKSAVDDEDADDANQEDEGDGGCDSDNDEVQNAASKAECVLNGTQLRQLLLQSSNSCVGGLTPLQLAVAADRPDVFLAVAAFAEESALPLGAVGVWADQVRREESGNDVNKAESQKPYRYASAGQSHTLLQVAFACGAKHVARLLLSGKADDTLLGWLEASIGAVKVKKASSSTSPQRKISNCIANADAARKWLVHHLSEHSMSRDSIARRLIGPTAVDAYERGAIFYAPSWAISDLDEFARAKDMKPAIFDHKSASGATALMAAARGWQDERIRLLMQAGCAVAASGKLGWNALHFAISSGGDAEWSTKRRVVDVLLDSASAEDVSNLLLAPSAEHTPLMLACTRGADGAFVRDLAERMMALGVQGLDGLARKDIQMSSAMHLAADNQKPDAVEILTELGSKCKSPAHEALNASIENARGATALEISMEDVVEVWEGNGKKGHMFGMGRRKKPRGFAKKTKSQPPANTREPKRSCLSTLFNHQGQRRTVSFDEVQRAASSAAQKADKSKASFAGHRQEGECEMDPYLPVLNLQQQLSEHSIYMWMPRIRD